MATCTIYENIIRALTVCKKINSCQIALLIAGDYILNVYCKRGVLLGCAMIISSKQGNGLQFHAVKIHRG